MSHLFLQLLSSHHKSTQPCLHYFRWHGGMELAGGTQGELGGPLQQSSLWSCTTLPRQDLCVLSHHHSHENVSTVSNNRWLVQKLCIAGDDQIIEHVWTYPECMPHDSLSISISCIWLPSSKAMPLAKDAPCHANADDLPAHAAVVASWSSWYSCRLILLIKTTKLNRWDLHALAK
jgi:hypothetical protein